MNITFENGQMVVTHESGIIDRYVKTDLEAVRTRVEQQRANLNDQIVELNFSIAEIEASLGA